MSIHLRPYQQTFIDNIRDAYAEGHKSVMAVLPTGGGKTICFSYIADNAAKRGNTTFILVHRKNLITQTSKSLKENGIHHGVIAASHPIIDLPIQVCSVQTLVRRLDKFKPPGLLVIDEAHHSKAKTYTDIIDWASDSALLGVTATPTRTDGRGFSDIFSDLVIGPGIAELIEDGWLSRPVLYAPKIPEIDLSNVGIVAGDYNVADLEVAMDQRVITGSAVEHYKRIVPHHPRSVAFCVSIEHAKHVAKEFTSAGIPFASIDGGMDDYEIQTCIRNLERGTIRGLASCDLISEGFDLPSIGCVIDLAPTKSLARHLQKIGRGLRISPDKTETIILDHVENYRDPNLGLVEQERDWREHFDGRKKREATSKGDNLSTCPQCYAVFPPVPICPVCGYNIKPASGDNARKIEQIDGELVRIDSAALLSFRSTGANGGRKKQVIRKLERIELPESLDHAKVIAKKSGFSDAWAQKSWEIINGS